MEGVKIMYDDLLTSKIEMLSFLGIEHTDPVLLNYLYKDFLVRRIKKNIFAKVILSDSARNRQYAGIDKKAKKESKVVAKKYFTLDA